MSSFFFFLFWFCFVFFFNDTATAEIYTLSLHDALPICKIIGAGKVKVAKLKAKDPCEQLITYGSESLLRAYWDAQTWSDRKSTRLNSSHGYISYAVFCLKKKKKKEKEKKKKKTTHKTI